MRPKAAALRAAKDDEISDEDDPSKALGHANPKALPKVFYTDVHFTPYQAIGDSLRSKQIRSLRPEAWKAGRTTCYSAFQSGFCQGQRFNEMGVSL